MTQYMQDSFTVGPKSSKTKAPCTSKFHGWPIRDGSGGYKCWWCTKPCTRDGKSVEVAAK